MELTLSLSNTQITVAIDGAHSHNFDLHALHIDDERNPLTAPVAYGQALYGALFPEGTPARQALTGADRVLLTADAALQGPHWEYLHDGESFLVLDHAFVRGLPSQRTAPPTLTGRPHIVAVPSNPLEKGGVPLNIEGEWLRLLSVIEGAQAALLQGALRSPVVGFAVFNYQKV